MLLALRLREVKDDAPGQKHLRLGAVELHHFESQALLEPRRNLANGGGVSGALGREDDRDVDVRPYPSPRDRQICTELPQNLQGACIVAQGP